MKNLKLLTVIILLASTAQADCLLTMENSAVYKMAEEFERPVKSVFIVRNEMGAWTEMVGNNTGSAEVAVKIGAQINYYRLSGKQIGNSDKCQVTAIQQLAVSSIDPLALQAERYRLAIGKAEHMSESDAEWMPFYRHTKVKAFTKEEFAKALHSNLVDVYTRNETESFFAGYIKEEENLSTRALYKRLHETLKKDFKDFRVIKVGEPDSGSLDLYIIGITPQGEIVGLQTISVET
jgi:hypothetical protein